MSTRERTRNTSSSKRRAAAALAVAAHAIQNPPTHLTSRPTIYNVGLVPPSWIKFDTISRMGVKINTGHTDLGTNPIEVTFKYRTYGAASGLIRVGIRKALDDSFLLIAEHPIDFNPATIGVQQTALIIGANPYSIVAGDLISIEFPASSTSSIELPVSTTEAFPTNTVSQQYVSSWLNTASNRPLAISIIAQRSTPI
jgi:hypothetical protein